MKAWGAAMVLASCLLGGLVVPAGAARGVAGVRPSEAHMSARSGRMSWLRIGVHQARLSVDIRQASLLKVLEEVARQSAIRFVLPTALRAEVSVQFNDLPLDQGVRRILRGHNIVMLYTNAGPQDVQGSPRRLTEVRVYPIQQAEGFTTIEPFRPLLTAAWGKKGEGGHDAGERVGNPLEAADALVREAAVEALGESGDTRAVPLLLRALEDEDEDVREATVEALGTLRAAEAVAALARTLRQDAEEDVRESAVEALVAIGGPQVVAPLINALHDEDADVRVTAVEALTEVGGPRVLAHVKSIALRDEDEEVRDAAEEALVELGKRSVGRTRRSPRR